MHECWRGPMSGIAWTTACSDVIAEREAPRRGVSWRLASYVLLNASVLFFWLYFFLLSRTRVVVKAPFQITRNTLFVSNHQSSVDSYLIAAATIVPRSLFHSWIHPWNLASAQHFFRTPLRAWCSERLRCIPVGSGNGNLTAIRRLQSELRQGVAHFFPEGTRSSDGALRAARPGLGFLVLAARPRVIPVAIDGTRGAIRFDRFGLRFFQRVRITFGESTDYASLPVDSAPSDRAAAERVTRDLMARVGRLLEEQRAQASEG